MGRESRVSKERTTKSGIKIVGTAEALKGAK